MLLLEKQNYFKLTEPLKSVTINNLFARFVIENRVAGSVYVDNVEAPSTFYVLHSYGMSLLFGDNKNAKFNAAFREYALNSKKTRNSYEWMQAFPGAWNETLSGLFKDCSVRSADNSGNNENKIELNTRVNFKFNREKYLSLKQNSNKENLSVVRTDKKIFADMKGSVVPAYFWESADDFLKNGIGFSLFHENKLASTAYSAFILDDKLELGIETVEEFRGKGLAYDACAALIDYCLENNYEPVWACRLENTGSYKLALKLGFEPSAEIPYYRLCK